MDLQRGFRVGTWEAYPLKGEIAADGDVRHLEPKVMEVLVVLAEQAPEVVRRDELTDRVWGVRAAVSDEPLTRCIAQLRQAFGDSARSPQYVQTVPKIGYRLLRPVTPLVADGQAVAAPAEPPPVAVESGRSFATRWLATVVAAVTVAAVLVGMRFLPEKPADNSIAILPFNDHIGRPEIARGVTDELHTVLTGIDSLRVALRPTTYGAAESTPDPIEVARTLGVAWTVTADLMSDGDGGFRIVWDLNDVVQGRARTHTTELSEGIDNLQAVLTGMCKVIVPVVGPGSAAISGCDRAELESDNPAALVALHRAKLRMRDRNSDGLNDAIGHLLTAIGLDPAYGQAYVLLARAYSLMPAYGAPEPREYWFDHARQVLDDGSGHAQSVGSGRHSVDAVMFYAERNWPKAHASFEQALARSPDDSDLLQLYSQFLSATGQREAALDIARQALKITPALPVANQRLAIMLTWAGEDAEASDYFALALESGIDEEANRKAQLVHLMRLGEYDEVGRLLHELLRVANHQAYPWIDDFIGVFEGGDRDRAIMSLEDAASHDWVDKELLFYAWLFLEQWDRALAVASSVTPSEDFSVEMLFSEEAAGLRAQEDFSVLLERFGIADYWDTFGVSNDFCIKERGRFRCD